MEEHLGTLQEKLERKMKQFEDFPFIDLYNLLSIVLID